jgi:hypothetical protein
MSIAALVEQKLGISLLPDWKLMARWFADCQD